ncbi:hypothetical protein Tco_0023421 [Tanacetum coccineum]
MYVDGGSVSEVLYEHCFNRLYSEVKSRMIPATTLLLGFSGEISWPLGQISLMVSLGEEYHSTSALMNFMVVRSPSPYNGIIGHSGLKKIQAVPSIAYRMLKFLVEGGIVTLRSSAIIPVEFRMVIKAPGGLPPNESAVVEGIKKPADKTSVLRSIAEHRLNVGEGCPPIRQKRRSQAPDRNKAIQKEVAKLVDAQIMREVHYHCWLMNPVMVKKHDDSWRMCVNFMDLNKACPKDYYPLLEVDWKIESLCGYPFKCFLDAYKGYHQIQMAEEDEEKIAFHISQGVSAIQKYRSALRTSGQRISDSWTMPLRNKLAET